MTARQPRGFTLLEILVVLAILGILTSAVMLSVRVDGSPEQAVSEARRLHRLVQLHCEQALLTTHPMGLQIGDGGYRFLTWRQGDQDWRALTERPFQTRTLPLSLTFDLEREGRSLTLPQDLDAELTPQIVCFGSGEATPFQLTIYTHEPQGHALVVGFIDGRIEVRDWREQS